MDIANASRVLGSALQGMLKSQRYTLRLGPCMLRLGPCAIPAQAPIVYQVTLQNFKTPEVRSLMLKWLRDGHIDRVIKTGAFTSANIFSSATVSDSPSSPIVVHYYAQDETSVRKYLSGPGKALQQEGLSKFGPNSFQASRAVLTLSDEFYA